MAVQNHMWQGCNLKTLNHIIWFCVISWGVVALWQLMIVLWQPPPTLWQPVAVIPHHTPVMATHGTCAIIHVSYGHIPNHTESYNKSLCYGSWRRRMASRMDVDVRNVVGAQKHLPIVLNYAGAMCACKYSTFCTVCRMYWCMHDLTFVKYIAPTVIDQNLSMGP